jgi:hypothetical protein
MHRGTDGAVGNTCCSLVSGSGAAANPGKQPLVPATPAVVVAIGVPDGPTGHSPDGPGNDSAGHGPDGGAPDCGATGGATAKGSCENDGQTENCYFHGKWWGS